MTQPELEKWQKGLELWDTWSQTTVTTRANIVAKYGDLTELVNRAKPEFPDIENEPIRNISDIMPIGNREYLKIWELYDEVEDIGKKFILEYIGLNPSEYYSIPLLNFWLYKTIPEIVVEPSGELSVPEEDIADLLHKPLRIDSKVVGKGSKQRIVDRVSWYRDEISPLQIAQIVQRVRWPSKKSLIQKAQAGRPQLSNTDLAPLEGIVCFLLNKRQRMTQAAIADDFRWKTPEDSKGNLMSNKVRSRIKLAKRLLENNTNA